MRHAEPGLALLLRIPHHQHAPPPPPPTCSAAPTSSSPKLPLYSAASCSPAPTRARHAAARNTGRRPQRFMARAPGTAAAQGVQYQVRATILHQLQQMLHLLLGHMMQQPLHEQRLHRPLPAAAGAGSCGWWLGLGYTRIGAGCGLCEGCCVCCWLWPRQQLS
jgi:hypothetical protein